MPVIADTAVLRPLASPSALYVYHFSAPQPPIRPIEIRKSPTSPTGLFNPGLCGGVAPHEFLFVRPRIRRARWLRVLLLPLVPGHPTLPE
jgi:hypothetical protein